MKYMAPSEIGINIITPWLCHIFDETSSKIVWGGMGKSIENKQLLLHFIFKKLVLKEGNIGYELNPPFCYMEGSASSQGSNGGANNGSCEPEETQGFEGNFSPNLSITKNTICEPQNIIKKQEVGPQNLTSVQSGRAHSAIHWLSNIIKKEILTNS